MGLLPIPLGKLPIHKDLVNGRALDENDDFHEDEVFGAIMPINEDRKESSRSQFVNEGP